MCKFAIIILFFLLPLVNAFAQQYNNWYFGQGAGLTFNTTATLTYPTVVNTNVMQATEGTISTSDTLGNLLYYSNGEKVVNKNHTIMSNGNNLLGNQSAYQNTLSVPQPGNPNLYYLFTTDAFENNFANGYRYNIIDISINNGLGEVVQKNTILNQSCTERLTAAQHSNGTDVWIIINENYSNTFKCYLLTCNGLSTTPVISTAGNVLNLFADMNVGAIKVSPDGKTLCQTHFPQSTTSGNAHYFQLFNFDASTGVINNARQVPLINRFAYGFEFSPNSTYLYLTDPNKPNLIQVNYTLPTPMAITNSQVIIPADFGLYGLQLAPNLSIYGTRVGRYLSVINNPNVQGLNCNYKDTTIFLNFKNAQINLPQNINNAYADPYNGFTYTTIDTCLGTVQFNAYSSLQPTASFTWHFGDGVTSTLKNPQHTYNTPNQLYTVRLIIKAPNNCATVYKSFTIIPQGSIAKPSFTYTNLCATLTTTFINTSATIPNNTNVLWQFGDGNTSTTYTPIHQYTTSGNYLVKLSILNSNPCLTKTDSMLLNYEALTTTLPDSITINEGQQAVLNLTTNANIFKWKPFIKLTDSLIQQPKASPITTTWYYVTATNNAGCVIRDSILIKVNAIKDVYVPSAFSPNNDGKNDVLMPTFSRSLTNVDFTIYNRWGKQVFVGNHTNNYTWNGKLNNTKMPIGTYVWQFISSNSNGKNVYKKGTVVLLY